MTAIRWTTTVTERTRPESSERRGDNGIGAVGVAWNPQILACKFLDATGTGDDAARRDPNAPFPYALRDAIDAAGHAGIKLERAGNLISAYESVDGVTWTLVGSDTVALPPTVYIGLAVTSHATAASATCTFDDVTMR